VAIATGQSISAIGMLRLSGPKAIDITDKIFKGIILANAATHTAHYGRIVNEEGDMLDEVVVTVYRAPHSYTMEDVVEISCHGSPYILKEVMSLLVRQGARPADPGEFTMRAFINGRMDLSQAEAVADLIESQSKVAHDIALRQMRGGVSGEIQSLREKLLDFASLIELELDFSEEDVEFADRKKLKTLVDEIIVLTGRLKNTFYLGNAIKEGIPTVIAGRPNAGKSTILNKLLQEERAIVSATPGTTRDTIEENLIIDGIQFKLIDTAGIREAHDEIESMGIQRTMEKIGKAAILIYVFDVTELDTSDVLRDLGAINPSSAKVILAANKMDLKPYADPEEWKVGDLTVVPLAAKNSMNIPYLIEVIGETVKKEIPADLPMITSLRHYHALDRAEERLRVVAEALSPSPPNNSNPPPTDYQPTDHPEPTTAYRPPTTDYRPPTTDLLAQDIRQALYHLGEITGEISTEDVLGNIFGRFCIGK
jgi:tRNA modification GTPase